MSLIKIRKTSLNIEHVFHEGGSVATNPLKVAVALAVIENPYAGRFEEDLLPFMKELRSLGAELSEQLIAGLGGPEKVQAYGKAAIVGEDGELEHGAVWHEAGGWAMREALGNPKAIVPSAKTVAGIGARLIVPLGHVNAAYVRSHFATAEMHIWDGPRRNEIVFGLAMATGGRIHARVGGLKAEDIAGDDGLR